MDNNKLVIGVVLAVAAFLGAPIALRALRPAPVAVAAAPAATATAPAPGNAYAAPQNNAQQGYPQAQQQEWQQPQGGGQAELNAQTLVGTMWEVRATQGTVKFLFNANGQGVATHAIAGQIPASWTCSGNQVNVTASAFGQTLTLSALIQGQRLVAQNCSIHRLR